jgi:RNA-directed DNA polymerase
MRQNRLICQLNPIIRGWAMYHRHAVSAKVFQSVDHAIFQTLWRWAKRRHPTKGVRWVTARYFHPIDDRNWVFSGTARGPKGKRRAVYLFTRLAKKLKHMFSPAFTGLS